MAVEQKATLFDIKRINIEKSQVYKKKNIGTEINRKLKEKLKCADV